MKTISLNQIEEFLGNDSFVLYGVSTRKDKMGNSIFKELTKNGYKLFPIHKEMETFENQKCFKNLAELPSKVNAAIVCTKHEKTEVILEELQNHGIKSVWLQQGSASPEIIQNANENFDNVISGKCILMFANQTGVHKFHSRILKFFGRYPKNNTTHHLSF
jgi:predicted CoA-binding protein